MSANTKPEIRELSADELELVGGGRNLLLGAFTQGVFNLAVAADYYFGSGGGKYFHASAEDEQYFVWR